MPVNLKLLEAHIERAKATPPNSVTRRKVSVALAESIRLMDDVALDRDNPVTIIQSNNQNTLTAELIHREQNERTYRQQKYNIIQTLSGLMESISRTSHSAVSDLSAGDKKALEEAHRIHQSLGQQMQRIALASRDAINLTPWANTRTGRRSIARAVEDAQDKHGTKPSALARQEIAKRTGQDFLRDYEDYLNNQFPTNQPDGSRPELSIRETLILGRQVYDALKSQVDMTNDFVASTLPSQVNAIVVSGQNTLRYNLPTEEGIATPEFWETLIKNNFSAPELLENIDHLSNTMLQDMLPPDQVVRSLMATLPSQSHNPVNPKIVYLDSEFGNDRPEDQPDILQIGIDLDNAIQVIADEDRQPVVVRALNGDLPDHLIVTAPGKSHKIVHAPSNPENTIKERVKERVETILDTAKTLEPNIPAPVVEERIRRLQKQWAGLTNKESMGSPEALVSQLDKLHQEIRETASMIAAPGFGQPAQRDNAKALVELALLASHGGSEYQKLPFRSPGGAGIKASNQRPGLVITKDEKLQNGGHLVHVEHTDDNGQPAGLQHIQANAGPGEERGQRVADAIIEASGQKDGHDKNVSVGKPIPQIKGLLTFTIGESGKPIQTGHWLSDEDRESITHHSPIGLTHRDTKGQPLFDENENRTSPATQSLKDAAVYLIHGESITPDNAIWAAEMAGYDGDYMLTVDPEDLAGSAKIRIQDSVFRECGPEDIKRHIIQKITLSETEPGQASEMIDRVRNTSWTKAQDTMNGLFEEADFRESMSPG